MGRDSQAGARRGWLAPLGRALAVVAVCTALGVFNWVNAFATMPYVQTARFGIWFIGSWLLWAPLVPPLAWGVRRLVAARPSPWILATAVAGGWVVIAAYRSVILAWLSRFSGPAGFSELPYGAGMWRRGIDPYAVLAYLAITGVLFTPPYLKRLRAEELAAARLEADLTRAELDAVRVQLHPQLIFDALQTTATFIAAGKPGTAVRLLARLSDLLRLMLATLGQEEVPLR